MRRGAACRRSHSGVASRTSRRLLLHSRSLFRLPIRPLARALVFCALGALAVSGPIRAQTGAEEPPGSIDFRAHNAIVRAHGVFHRWHFTHVEVDAVQPERSEVELEVEIASIDTGVGRRDRHLRSADFFDAEHYPVAQARVYDAHPAGRSESGNPLYRAQLELRIRDVTKTFDLLFELVSREPARVRGRIEIDRTAFGVGSPHMSWNPMSIGNRVRVEFDALLPHGKALGRREAGPEPGRAE